MTVQPHPPTGPRRLGTRVSASRPLRLAGLALPLLLAAGGVRAEPASTLAAMWRQLGACTEAVGGPVEAAGSEVTVLVSIKRDGSLQGRPRITHSRLVGDEGAQRIFLSGVLESIARCFPLSITDGLGGAVAGRPLRLRVMNRQKERNA